MAMFWDFTSKGRCPNCTCKNPAERSECTHHEDGDPGFLSNDADVLFWLSVFVICVLHMKLRIVNHFVEHLTGQVIGSTYWLTNLFAAFGSINLRYRLYDH